MIVLAWLALFGLLLLAINALVEYLAAMNLSICERSEVFDWEKHCPATDFNEEVAA